MPLGYSSRTQHGIALLSALITVLIVSVLGVAIGKQVLDERRNSTLYYDHTSSLIRAESALTEARAVITENDPSISSRLDPDDEDTLLVAAFSSGNWWQTESNWGAAVEVTKSSNALLAGTPVYVLEDAGTEPQLDLGRNLPVRRFIKITARASGLGSAESVLQATVAVME